jgi:hypothetical protein
VVFATDLTFLETILIQLRALAIQKKGGSTTVDNAIFGGATLFVEQIAPSSLADGGYNLKNVLVSGGTTPDFTKTGLLNLGFYDAGYNSSLMDKMSSKYYTSTGGNDALWNVMATIYKTVTDSGATPASVASTVAGLYSSANLNPAIYELNAGAFIANEAAGIPFVEVEAETTLIGCYMLGRKKY